MVFSAHAPRALALAVCLLVLSMANAVRGSESTPLLGCYERRYDAAHLASHPGQIVLRVRLDVEKTAVPASYSPPIVADANLEIWVRKNKHSFGSVGVCKAEDEGLICNGAVSAAETDVCKTKMDGVRHCRIDFANAGSFYIAKRPDGVLLTVGERLRARRSTLGLRPLPLSEPRKCAKSRLSARKSRPLGLQTINSTDRAERAKKTLAESIALVEPYWVEVPRLFPVIHQILHDIDDLLIADTIS